MRSTVSHDLCPLKALAKLGLLLFIEEEDHWVFVVGYVLLEVFTRLDVEDMALAVLLC